ncbi:hypothetical protein C2E21_8108 [Chlorella sorokiniana]|uniref:Uncharacterized protein n=1 Tax=Chlorella sorokiniana TaxID=3076 RepID=A0A2P6TFE1_CHLSO|nr:hypothetical protein C2E21_8108 [Chlorella sorokiniana]|eukprot:PRW32833.1 hypothetical protein C2E21_8108 [Chlorella sorokiniana]
MATLATQLIETEQQADWASLPPELLALVCRALLVDLQAHGPCTLRDASRAMAALSPCSAWRRVALEEAAFSIRLGEWSEAHLASVPIRELTLPALLPKDPAASAAAFIKHTGRVLCSAAFRRRSGTSLEALHSVPLQAVAAGQLLGWSALRRLSINPDSLPDGGGASVPPFLPGAFPPSLQELDLPVPRHPFRLPGGLPQQLDRLVLRCTGSDFIVGRHIVLGSGEAEAEQAATAAGAAEAAAAGTAGAAGEAAPPRWRRLEVHAGRAAVLDLDDLPLLAGVCSSLALHGPLVMVATSDPAHAALLVAPPVRSLDRCISQYQQVLAPALAAAGIRQLTLVASETSFYCKQPGRRVVLDATALPPLGAQRASAAVEGYAASLTWPAASNDAAGPGTLLPTLCLSVARSAS